MTKELGRLNLSTQQFQRLMNIIHIESVLLVLNKAKETYINTKPVLQIRYKTVAKEQFRFF